MKRTIEILAPAGSYEGMKAAMNAGCDAVYIGGNSFGARAYANNLEEETLLRAIDEAHIRDKSLYLTVNTLLKEKERVDDLYQFLDKFYLHGLDAVIVQDVGVMHFVHRHFPELPIHASTQTTITMAEGANLLKDIGVTRLVTARELGLEEIKEIRNNTNLEIETFVHGALCYCYSGQCLMSSMIGGRSGNRGRCAQPCRMPYQFHSKDKLLSNQKDSYLLSPKDINTIAIIPDLVEAGIDSFKIEGRMKRPEYAAAVSFLYRKYVDLYFSLGKEDYNLFIQKNDFDKDMIMLQDVYNRGGFSEGYGLTYHGKKMMSMHRPNHSGVLIGEVKDIKGNQVSIAVKEEINAQDILEIRHQGEEEFEFTVKDPHKIGDILRTNFGVRRDEKERKPNATDKRKDDRSKEFKQSGPQKKKIVGPALAIGDPVYRTKNNALLDRLGKEYLEKNLRLGIKGRLSAKLGQRLALTIAYKEIQVSVYQDVVQEAVNQPITKDKLSASIEKLGDTLFYFEELEINSDQNIFVPVAWLNEIRRESISKLQEEIVKSYRRKDETKLQGFKEFESHCETENIVTAAGVKDKTIEDDSKVRKITASKDNMGMCISVQTDEQFKAALAIKEISAIYVDFDSYERSNILTMANAASQQGKEYYITLPHICRKSEYLRLKRELYEIIENKNIAGFIVKNFEEIAMLDSLKLVGKVQIILNYNMYTYNSEAKQFWREKGIHHFTAPVELNHQELRALTVTDSDMIVYGHLPLMVSSQCLFDNTGGCQKGKGGEYQHAGHLTDRLGKKFLVQANCRGCYNIIYNGQALSLLKQDKEIMSLQPKNLRLDFTMETPEMMKQIVTAFVDTYYYGKSNSIQLSEYTTGHFKRGVE
jgi:putative protease